MVQVYYELIKLGKWTIERVPVNWRADVQAKLDADKKPEPTPPTPTPEPEPEVETEPENPDNN